MPPVGELGAQIFLFCSGYGLTYSTLGRGSLNLADYWKKRFVRIYPLYVLALLLYMQFIYKIDFENFLIHSVFLHSFFLKISHTPEPFWFMGVLFQLYLIFPFLFQLSIKKTNLFWIIITALFLLNSLVISFIQYQISFAERLESSVADSSILSFIIPVAVGIYLAHKVYINDMVSVLKLRKNMLLLSMGIVLLIAAYMLVAGFSYQVLHESVKLVFSFFASAFILVLIVWMKPRIFKLNENIINFFSTGIFCCYLFHEFIFAWFGFFSKDFVVVPFAVLAAVLAGVPVQILYNRAVEFVQLVFRNNDPAH